MGFTFRGVAETKAAFAKLQAEIEVASPAAVKAGGEVVGRAAISRAPRATGETASSIRVDTESLGEGATAHVGPTTPWARFTESGTVYISAQHWLSDAAGSSTSGIEAAMIAVYRAALPN